MPQDVEAADYFCAGIFPQEKRDLSCRSSLGCSLTESSDSILH